MNTDYGGPCCSPQQHNRNGRGTVRIRHLRLNAQPERVILGGVSNGRVWYFAKLEANAMTQDPRAFIIDDLAELFAALNFLFHIAKEESLAAA